MKASHYSIGLVLVLVASGFLLFGCPATAVNQDAIAVWQQKGADYDVWYSVWDHTAKKWSTPSGAVTAPVSAMAGAENDPDVSTDGKRKAVAVWSSQSGGTSSIYASFWKEGVWSAPAKISSGSADTDPTVAMSPDGSAVAVWVSGGSILFYSAYSPAGGWSAQEKITSMDRVSLPEIAYSGGSGGYDIVFTAASGTATAAYGSEYSGSWSAPAPISSSALLDNSAPTDQRTGISGNVAVFPEADGVYSSALFSTASKFSDGAMPDVAHDAAGVPNGAYFKPGDLYHSPNVLASAAGGAISALPGDDLRPSLTFILKQTVGLVVFWKDAGIYYSYMENGAWVSPKQLGQSQGRNPAVAPLSYSVGDEPYCGDKVLQPPEQCEVGIPCAKAGDVCTIPGCLCSPPKNKTKPYCGDKILQAGEQCEVGIACPAANQICKVPPCKCFIKDEPPPPKNVSCADNSKLPVGANSFDPKGDTFCRDDCKEKMGGDDYVCDIKTCTCMKKETQSCAANTLTVNYPKGSASPVLACKDDCKSLNPNWVCDTQGCFCKETRTVTPRCGDGYVSGPNTPGGGFEECDVGFGFYQPKDAAGKPITSPDTCPAPKVCDPPTCKCKAPPITENITETYCGDGIRNGNEQCDGNDRSACSTGQSCSSCQCVTPTTSSVCGNQVVEQGELCEPSLGCTTQIGGQTVSGTCSSGCNQCNVELYCGDGILYGNEQCDPGSQGTNVCSSGHYCSGCQCLPNPTHMACQQGACVTVQGAGSSTCSVNSDCVPPVIDCPAYCSGAGYSQNLGGGYSNSQACYAAATSGTPATCTTLCQFAKYYTESNQAGTTSCCCGKQVSLACSDCPGQNPVCPAQSACEAYNPG